MATDSSIFAWRIPWTEEPGGLHSIGLQRVGHDLVTKPSNSKRLHIPTRSSFISTSVRTVMTGARGAVKTGIRNLLLDNGRCPGKKQ